VQDRESVEAEYRANAGRYERLVDEVVFALEAGLKRAGIKAHTVGGRVKTLDSFVEKIERKQYANPFADTPDLVGVRIVVLFLSDLPRVSELVRDLFDVHSEEDRVHEGPDTTFGYMSIHYVAELDTSVSGARYDDLKQLRFEIQVRTIVMDAWANVSHYLAYKGESSVPQALRRDFNALSGLFYVADQHFELFVRDAQRSEVEAREVVEAAEHKDQPVELNLDTVAAVIRRAFPDRRHAERSEPMMSVFVDELQAAGFDDARDLERGLRGVHAAVAAQEEVLGHPSPWYTDLGAARTGLLIANDAYRKALKDMGFDPPDLELRKLVTGD
jgi:ppGpp synthetase/RelA/SpoT-type nucleotidyltranferase